jgi:tetratricopeptide (TPR) repeat protein
VVAAVNLFRRALALYASRDTVRAELLLELGVALQETEDAREALATLGEAVEIAEQEGDGPLAWRTRIRRSAAGMLADPHGTPTGRVRAELEEAVHVFEELGDEAGLALAWVLLAETEFMPCRFGAGERAARRALEHARRSGEERLIREAVRATIATQYFGLGTPQQAEGTFDELQDELSRSQESVSFARALRGGYLAMRGEIDEARRLFEEAVEIAEALGHRFMVAAALQGRGDIEAAVGDPALAEQALRRSYEILDGLGDEGHKSTTAAYLARVLSMTDRLEEADSFARIARDVAAEDDLASQAAGRSANALVLSGRGRFEEAEALSREAIGMYAEAENPNSHGDLWMDLARILRSAGKPAEASAAAREALGHYERKGNVAVVARARSFIEELGEPLDRSAKAP